MKKFNLLCIATLVAFGSLFTSCKDDEAGTVSVTLDATAFSNGTAVTGTITSTNKLESVTLLEDGTTVSGWPITDFTTGMPVVGDDGSYTIRITGLANGNYTIRATDKDGVESSQDFSVGSLYEVSTSVTILCQLGDGSTASTCASATGSTFASNGTTLVNQALIDFVYFNAGGTALAIYAPSAIPAAINNATTGFSAWTVKNATTFAKTTAGSYSTATYPQVKALALATTANSVTGLAAGDVVVFKTAYGTVGLFEVNSITPGFTSTDNVNIKIKIAQ